MISVTRELIANQIAHSPVIFQRGLRLYEHGGFMCMEGDVETGRFVYDVDGSFGDYTAKINLNEESVQTSCNCPFPEDGCKHTVAVLLDIQDKVAGWQQRHSAQGGAIDDIQPPEPFLTAEEIKSLALKDRRQRAQKEAFNFITGDMYKGTHLVETDKGFQYQVVIHDPLNERGHCSCPDYATNRLNICKHIIALCTVFERKRGFKTRLARETFPFADIFWDSEAARPRLFCELSAKKLGKIAPLLKANFNGDGLYAQAELTAMVPLLEEIRRFKCVRVQETVYQQVDAYLHRRQLAELSRQKLPPLNMLKTELYPYQVEGVKFGLYQSAVLIGDEMGLGKTMQAIALALLKRDHFGFENVLVITLASLKEQWKREIEKFTAEKAVVVAGSAAKRAEIYQTDRAFFKITNYEAVLRDVTILVRFKPDLIILDEAQRIKNFNTKTAGAVKRLPRRHALVLTGTPLENKLEDVYSIIQFLDPLMLAPLWQFAADHFMLSRHKKGKILGYRNLDLLKEKLKTIVIRRRKEEVLKDLPDVVENNYFVDLTVEQVEIHQGYARLLAPYLSKKFLTPIDLQRMMELMLKMRMVCDSTYLIDRQTHLSPKLKELESILDELVVQNERKVVIFSEWTTMTFLIAKHLSRAGIAFVELTGRIPVKKRQALIDEFTNNPDCKVFLSTDAGGTGLNLQAADCVINFELPWSPAKLNQRIGRVNRIGQSSACINVVNLIAKGAIEEKILAGLRLKTDLFDGVFNQGPDVVEFSQERRTELLNQLRALLDEEPLRAPGEIRPEEEIPEDTPHYLNPQVLSEEKQEIAFEAEENQLETSAGNALDGDGAHADEATSDSSANPHSPEQMESVLNSGMQFLGGLLEMATGQKIEPTTEDQKMISLDKETGEVTLKFKLPGF
jgi:superfamily II DNA or RNA helicase